MEDWLLDHMQGYNKKGTDYTLDKTRDQVEEGFDGVLNFSSKNNQFVGAVRDLSFSDDDEDDFEEIEFNSPMGLTIPGESNVPVVIVTPVE